MSQAIEDLGGRAYRMEIHNGFDLTKRTGFLKALKTLRELRPRYLHVSPPCYPWTSMNNANQKNQQQVENLLEKRRQGRVILKHCLKLIQVQRQELRSQTGFDLVPRNPRDMQVANSLSEPLLGKNPRCERWLHYVAENVSIVMDANAG